MMTRRSLALSSALPLCLCASVVVLSFFGRAALALAPDEIAVICNLREPASPDLANFYVQARGLPPDRIIELDLPPGEQMGAERFDPDVIQPVRKALVERNLRGKVKCLLTVYGVPLKLAPRRNKPAEQEELKSLQSDVDRLNQQIAHTVTSLEVIVMRDDPTFKPSFAADMPQMMKRAEVAMQRARQALSSLRDPTAQEELQQAMMNTIAQLSGAAGIVRGTRPEALRNLTTRPATGPITQPYTAFNQMRDDVAAATSELQQLSLRRYDANARKRRRELTDKWLGDVELLRLLQSQIGYLAPDAVKAFDSELSLLWEENIPNRALANPLRIMAQSQQTGRNLMVSRLDGPQTGTGRDIVLAAKAVEAKGLDGSVVIDSRGIQPRNDKGGVDAYGAYDQRLRDLATLLQRGTKLHLTLDDTPDIIRPPHVVDGVAVYCGWYSVRNYVPAFKFVPGAIAFHVGSYEMVSLHDPNEKGWCRGLLADGVAATLGPVDEPYLDAFPNPEEFFPLIFTGKYTVAEAYWMTSPVVNWKMVLIADPLYNPYRAKPALAVEDLPARLRDLLQEAKPLPIDEEHLP